MDDEAAMNKKTDSSSEHRMENYKTPDKLNTRISIHDKYSENRQGFSAWLFQNMQLKENMRILEVGCGTGQLWSSNYDLIPAGCRITLTDSSAGMIDSVKQTFGTKNFFEYAVVDAQALPFDEASFDVVIANMVMYHVPNRNRAFSEFARVLKSDGTVYCATYGENGMVADLIQMLEGFELRDVRNLTFTLQNGAAQMEPFFSCVERLDYEDALLITDIDDILDYLYSLPSASSLSPKARPAMKIALEKHMLSGILRISKEYGMLVAYM